MLTASETASEHIPEALCKLPIFRPVVTRMLQFIGRDDYSMAELCDLIQTDPGLSGEILIMANSPLYGFPSTIRTVRHAVTVLGTDQIRRLAMAIAMKAYVQKGNNELVRRCWSHSIACAVISEALAATIRLSKEHAYTAGLLHEMGRLGMLITYPKEYGLLASQSVTDMQSSLEAERRLLGLDHCQAGLWLTRTWNLPEEFRDANARHHEPPHGPRDLLFAVRAGCLLAEALGFPEAMPPTEMPTLDEIESVLPRGISQDLPDWFADMRERIVENIDMLRN